MFICFIVVFSLTACGANETIREAEARAVKWIIEQKFGKMTITRGLEHVFLGMHLKFNPADRSTEVGVKDYLRECIRDSNLGIAHVAPTPARKNLFAIDDTAEPLPEPERETFHSIVSKLLFAALRGRPDILLPVIFLCGRATKATIQDQKKLRRVLEYLNGTLDLVLTLSADNLHNWQVWVDASFAVHPNMRSHTGATTSFGRGVFMCKTGQQKLNTTSSTWAELVGVSDYLPNILWLINFMIHQGYPPKHVDLAQDNESALRLCQNGRALAGRRSRHIDIRHFFITDAAKQHNIRIHHCPTQHMLADFFTKPLQGSLFRKFRDALLGITHISSLTDSSPASEERVEDAGAINQKAVVERPESPKSVTWSSIVRDGVSHQTKDASQSSLFEKSPVDSLK